jgi:hypothetical protein
MDDPAGGRDTGTVIQVGLFVGVLHLAQTQRFSQKYQVL